MREMDMELMIEIVGIKIWEALVISIRGVRSAYNNMPFLVGFSGFILFLYIFCPTLSSVLRSASPVLILAGLLGDLILSIYRESNVFEAPMDNVSFHSVESVQKWKYVYQRRLALESELGKETLESQEVMEVMELIESAGLMKTVRGLGDCYEKLVKEFLVNISYDCDNEQSKEFRKVFVRGMCVEFSPAVINKFLGRSEDAEAEVEVEVTDDEICKEITAKQVKEWPENDELSARKLSVRYAILHMIGAANWVPTNHTSTITTHLGKFIYLVGTKARFDFGSYVFKETMKHANSSRVKMSIAFPSLLCGVILSEHPSILSSSDVASKRESPLTSYYRLCNEKHVPDIVVPLGKEAGCSTSKEGVVAELKDTCKFLGETIKSCTEKESRLETLIKALSKEDIDGNLDGDEEEGNEDEGNVAADVDQDERNVAVAADGYQDEGNVAADVVAVAADGYQDEGNVAADVVAVAADGYQDEGNVAADVDQDERNVAVAADGYQDEGNVAPDGDQVEEIADGDSQNLSITIVL